MLPCLVRVRAEPEGGVQACGPSTRRQKSRGEDPLDTGRRRGRGRSWALPRGRLGRGARRAAQRRPGASGHYRSAACGEVGPGRRAGVQGCGWPTAEVMLVGAGGRREALTGSPGAAGATSPPHRKSRPEAGAVSTSCPSPAAQWGGGRGLGQAFHPSPASTHPETRPCSPSHACVAAHVCTHNHTTHPPAHHHVCRNRLLGDQTRGRGEGSPAKPSAAPWGGGRLEPLSPEAGLGAVSWEAGLQPHLSAPGPAPSPPSIFSATGGPSRLHGHFPVRELGTYSRLP